MKTLTPLFVVKAHYFRQSNTNTIIEEKFGLDNGKYLKQLKLKKNSEKINAIISILSREKLSVKTEK